MKRQLNTSITTSSRSAFTLLELLAVIVIISILVALILPALQGAFRNANNAEVTAEFTQLDSAIQAFSQDFGGIEPWSSIVLTENWSTSPWPVDTRTKIRRLWPQFNFSPRDSGGNPINFDLNGDGLLVGDPNRSDEYLELTGTEALLFFLSGVPSPGSPKTRLGFSKNPIMPFQFGGESRTAVYHEFDIDRMIDQDGDLALGYTDTIGDGTAEIHYVSSNNSQGYSEADGALNYYVQDDGKTPWNRSSYQLVSAGEDGEFGFLLRPNPFLTLPPDTSDSRPRFGENNEAKGFQADNLTNFNTSGTLGK